MIPKKFDEANHVLGKDQPEYGNLPVYFNDKEGSVTMCFELDEDERNRIYSTGEIWFKQLTFGKPFHPIVGSANKEDLL